MCGVEIAGGSGVGFPSLEVRGIVEKVMSCRNKYTIPVSVGKDFSRANGMRACKCLVPCQESLGVRL